MKLDLRLPIGLLFGLLGLLLLLYGMMADPSIYQPSLGINVNVWSGGLMLAFGLVMLGLARRAAGRERAAGDGASPAPES